MQFFLHIFNFSHLLVDCNIKTKNTSLFMGSKCPIFQWNVALGREKGKSTAVLFPYLVINCSHAKSPRYGQISECSGEGTCDNIS